MFSSSTSLPSPPTRRDSGGRLLVICFDGTLAGSVQTSRGTVVPYLARAISKMEDKIVNRYEGVGNTGRYLRWIWESITGSGAKKIVFNGLGWLAENYRPGDKIIMIGYSRGAWKACYLAKLIDALGGLPVDADEGFLYELYRRSSKNKMIDKRDVEALLTKYPIHRDVQIEALCLFDTVSSMGLPTTGVAKPLGLIKGGWARKDEVIKDIPANTRHVFSAVSLYENRAPYIATLFRGRAASDGRLRQVAFPGNHGNLGWISKSNRNPLILGPLAWMAQQLESIGIHMDGAVLGEYFAPDQMSENGQDWVRGTVYRAHGYEHFIGTSAPRPGRIVDSNSDVPAVDIHFTARLRGYGRRRTDPAVPGYRLHTQGGGTNQWIRNDSSTCTVSATWPIIRRPTTASDIQRTTTWGPKEALTLNEAPIGPLEARLLRLEPKS